MITKERNSNFELLRLFSMFSIVFYHLLLFKINALSDSYWLYKGLTIISHFGVIVFVLISGWFGIKLSWKRIFNIYIPCIVYAILIYFLFADKWELKTFLSLFFPFDNDNPLWFIPVYFYLCLLSPIVNKLLDSYSASDYIKTLLLLSIFEFYFGFIRGYEVAWEGRKIICFIFLYILGRFCRILIATKLNNKLLKFRKCSLLILFFIFIGILFCKYSGVVFLSKLSGSFFAYNSPGLIFIAILILFVFSTFSIQLRAINFIASSSFAIYLIGSNPYILNFTNNVGEYLYKSSSFVGIQLMLLLFFSVIICIVCLSIDLLINNLFIKPFSSLICRILKAVEPFFVDIYNKILRKIE